MTPPHARRRGGGKGAACIRRALRSSCRCPYCRHPLHDPAADPVADPAASLSNDQRPDSYEDEVLYEEDGRPHSTQRVLIRHG